MIKAPFVLSIALGMFFMPLAKAETANPLDKTPSSFAKMGDVRIHYKSIGSGDTALVFIHGWTADMTSWRYQVPAFADRIRMILIDLPGHGQSDKPKTDYTMDFFAKSIDVALKDAGVEHAVLVGHSMGTPVIRQFYRLYPEKTRGLVSVDGALRPFPMTREQLDKFIGRFTGPDFKTNYDKFIAAMLSERTPPAVRKDLKEHLPTAPQFVAVSAMRGIFAPAVWKDDPIKVPLLVVLAKSPAWSADYEAYVRKLAPQVDYRPMEGVGHFLMMEKPDVFNEILVEFLRKQGFLKA
jgi:pimeloyl-ACP methyl ester carboxylesterase